MGLRGLIWGLRGVWRGVWTYVRMDGWMYGNSPLCPTGHWPFGAATQKVLDGQWYRMPLCEYMLFDAERGSGSEGANDLCLVSFEDLGLKVSINNGI